MKIVSFMAAATVAVVMTLVGCGDGPGKTPETTTPAANPLAGTWVAVLPQNPMTGLTTTITLNIIDTETVDTFTLTVNTPMKPAPMEQEFSGMVEVTDTMITATITGISNDGEAVPAAAVPGVLAQLKLSATQELTYTVSETDPPTVTVMGDLLTALGLPGGTLMAEKIG